MPTVTKIYQNIPEADQKGEGECILRSGMLDVH